MTIAIGTKRILIVGVGNDMRGDDAIGLYAVRQIRDQYGETVDTAESGGDLLALIDAWAEYEHVILIDAARSKDPAGTMQQFDVTHGDLPSDSLTLSSHGYGIADVVRLARQLHRMPRQLTVYALTGQTFDFNTEISPALREAADALITTLEQQVVSHL